MTLFAALTSTSSSSSSTRGTSSSSCSPPEAIQLYSNLSIDFLSGTTRSLDVRHDAAGRSDATASDANNDANANNNDASSRYFSMLSYQAVQVDGIKSNGSGNNDHSRPDLGIWDCRVALPESSRRSTTTTTSPTDDGGVSAASTVLRRVVVDRRRRHGATKTGEHSNPGEEKKDDDTAGDNRESNAPSPSIVRTVILAVDLSDPPRVQPTLEEMRRVVVDTYRDLPPIDDATPTGAHATSVDALAHTAFGSARIVDRRADETGPRIALLLAAILPRSLPSDDAAARDESPAHEYQRKQTRALLLYHLHKFAWEVDAALCFVGEGGDDDRDFLLGRNSAMSVDRFADVVRRVASGAPPSHDEEDLAVGVGGATSSRADGDGNAEHADESAASTAPKPLPAMHPPGTHDAELIRGAYLRNASCEGTWDAARDDLIQALPPLPIESRCVDFDTTSSGGDDDDEESPSSSKGDEEFLSKLASSVGIDPDSLSSSSYDTGVLGSPVKSAVGSGREGSATEGGEGTAGNAKAMADKKALLKKKSARVGAGGAAKKDQKEVSSFFESLLKK